MAGLSHRFEAETCLEELDKVCFGHIPYMSSNTEFRFCVELSAKTCPSLAKIPLRAGTYG